MSEPSDEAEGPRLRVDVFSIFPDMLRAVFGESVLGRGQANGTLDLRAHDLRMATTDRHRSVDDTPFGGGAGMVMMPEPLFAAVEAGGRRFDQSMAAELASSGGFSLLCGRYEGVDQRVIDHLADGEVSIGDMVLAGGETAAMVIVEAAARLVPGVLGNVASPEDESFADGLLEYPQFTRPAEFRGWAVPDVLRSGDHARVDRWRRAAALDRTRRHRPDLLERRGGLTPEERSLLDEFGF